MWIRSVERSRRRPLILPCLLLAVIQVCASECFSEDTVYRVGRPKNLGLGGHAWIEEGSRVIDKFESANVASDGRGNPYIIYGEGKLYLARRQDDQWKIEPVEIEEEMYQPAIALDDLDRVHIAYYAHSRIRHAVKKDDNQWEVETVRGKTWLDSRPDNGSFQLTVDVKDKPSLLYEDDFDGSLKLIQKSNGKWSEETIFDPSRYVVDLGSSCVDAEGIRHAFAAYENSLYHLYKEADSWSAPKVLAPTLAFNESGCTSSDIDSANRVFILYYTPEKKAAVATSVNGVWKIETIGTSPSTHDCTFSDVATNSRGETWTAFIEDADQRVTSDETSKLEQPEEDSETVAIRFGKLGGDGAPPFEIAYVGPPILGLGLLFDGGDFPSIFLQDSKTGDLLCRRKDSRNWSTEIVDAEVGLFNLIWVD